VFFVLEKILNDNNCFKKKKACLKEPRFNGKETRTVLYLGKDNNRVVETRTLTITITTINNNEGRGNNTILLCVLKY
jgi:hypothetical protein